MEFPPPSTHSRSGKCFSSCVALDEFLGSLQSQGEGLDNRRDYSRMFRRVTRAAGEQGREEGQGVCVGLRALGPELQTNRNPKVL